MSSHFVSYETLIAYAANELDERESGLVAEHAADCAACSKTVKLFRSVREVLRADVMVTPPSDILARAIAIFPEHVVSYEQLIAYAADDLDESETARIAEHLPTCEKCAATVTRFRMIHYLMSAHKTEAPPAATLVHAQNRFNSFVRPAQPAQPERKWRKVFEVVPMPLRFSAVALAILILLVPLLFAGSSTVTTTAKVAIPGDALYPVKTTLENTQVNLAPDSATKTELYLSFTQQRVEEIAALVTQGKYKEIPEVTKTFESQVEKVTLNLTTTIASGTDSRNAELSQKVDTALAQYSTTLTKLNESGPVEVKPSLERAAAVSSEQQKIVRGILMNSSPALPTPPPATVTSVPVLVIATPTDLSLPTATLLPLATSTSAIPTATSLAFPSGTPTLAPATALPPPPTVLVIPTSVIEKYFPTIVPPTATSVIQKSLPTATPIPPLPTIAPIIPTATPVPPSPTSVPIILTDTPAPPTPTNVPVVPTAGPLQMPTLPLVSPSPTP